MPVATWHPTTDGAVNLDAAQWVSFERTLTSSSWHLTVVAMTADYDGVTKLHLLADDEGKALTFPTKADAANHLRQAVHR